MGKQMEASEAREAYSVADSTFRSFETVLGLLTKEQQLATAKRLELRIRTLMESLEKYHAPRHK